MSNYDEAKHLTLRKKWLDIIHECRNSVTNLKVENRKLHDTVTFLTHQLCASKTKNTSSLGLPGQLSLFDEIEQTCSNEIQKPERKDIKSFPKEVT